MKAKVKKRSIALIWLIAKFDVITHRAKVDDGVCTSPFLERRRNWVVDATTYTLRDVQHELESSFIEYEKLEMTLRALREESTADGSCHARIARKITSVRNRQIDVLLFIKTCISDVHQYLVELQSFYSTQTVEYMSAIQKRLNIDIQRTNRVLFSIDFNESFNMFLNDNNEILTKVSMISIKEEAS